MYTVVPTDDSFVWIRRMPTCFEILLPVFSAKKSLTWASDQNTAPIIAKNSLLSFWQKNFKGNVQHVLS
jgi:hypothetical protein